jgi:hypothetical protein
MRAFRLERAASPTWKKILISIQPQKLDSSKISFAHF